MGRYPMAVGVTALLLGALGCGSRGSLPLLPLQVPDASYHSRPWPGAALAAREGASTGPNGEAPTPATDVQLSGEEIAQIKRMHASAAIVLRYGGNAWATAVTAGLRSEFRKMAIDVVAITDAGSKPEKQVSDLETVLAKKPDIIVSAPIEIAASAEVYRKAASRHIRLVFMGSAPRGLTAGKEYVSTVASDNYGNGVVAAKLMGTALGGRGNIGVIYYASDLFVTQERYRGFKKTIDEQFPNLQIVEEQGIGGPDFAGDAERAASAMLIKHRSLDGIWAVWDVPAEGVIAAGRTTGRSKLIITTCDLGEIVAIDLARGGFVKGIGAQLAFDQGAAQARLAGYGLLRKTAPAYVSVPVLPVTRENLLEAWKAVYHEDLPPDIRQCLVRASPTGTPFAFWWPSAFAGQ